MSWFKKLFCCCISERKYDFDEIENKNIVLSCKTNKIKERLNLLDRRDVMIFGYGVNSKSIKIIRQENLKYTISKIVFGDSHMIFLFENNKNIIGLRGSNFFNQLGLANEFNGENSKIESFNKTEGDDIQDIFQISHFFDDIVFHKHKLENSYDYEYVDVACESNRTLILVRFKNKKYNELFIVGDKNIFLDINERKFFDENHIMKLDLNYKTKNIKKILAKKNTTVLTTENNDIYLRGPSFFNFDDEKFHLICKNFDKEIDSIEIGNEHLLLLTKENQLFVYGNNTYGELGYPGFNNLYLLTELTYFKDKHLKILKISSGGRHNLVLCNDKNIYAFGDNSQFQCSGMNNFYKTPYQISNHFQFEILDIFAGYNFSVCYTNQEMLWSWGDNSNYKLGTDINLKGCSEPVFSNDLIGLNIGNVFAGINHMAVILSDYQGCLKFKNFKLNQ